MLQETLFEECASWKLSLAHFPEDPDQRGALFGRLSVCSPAAEHRQRRSSRSVSAHRKMQTLCSFLFSNLLPRVTFAFKLEFEIIEKDKLPRAQLSGARFILASSSDLLFSSGNGFHDICLLRETSFTRRNSERNSIRKRVLYHHYPKDFSRKEKNEN